MSWKPVEFLRSLVPCLLQPSIDLVVYITWGMDLHMVCEPTGRRLHHFLPARGWVPPAKQKGEDQRSPPAVQIFSRPPGICKRLFPAEGDLAFLDDDFHRPQRFDPLPQIIKQPPGFFIALEVFVECHFLDGSLRVVVSLVGVTGSEYILLLFLLKNNILKWPVSTLPAASHRLDHPHRFEKTFPYSG